MAGRVTRANGGWSSVSILSVWLCVERFQSFSTASMQQFVSFNQQRCVTLTSTFARRSSVPAALPFFKIKLAELHESYFIKLILRRDCLGITVTEYPNTQQNKDAVMCKGRFSVGSNDLLLFCSKDAFHSTSEKSENLNR